MDNLPPTVHETAIVDHGSHIGPGSKVWHWSHISSGVFIGDNCMIGQGVFVGEQVMIGNGCRIQNGAQIFTGVTLEEDVFIGPHVVFTNVLYPRAFKSQRDSFKKTLVKKGAMIGANATILCGVTIGGGAMIGAGSVITRDISPFEVVSGASKHLRFIWKD